MSKPAPGRFILLPKLRAPAIPFEPAADGYTSPGRHLEGEEFEARKRELLARDAEERRKVTHA